MRAVEVGEDVGGGGGAGVSEEIGAGSCDGQSGGFEECVCGGVCRDADADEFPAGGDGVGDGGVAREEERERAGPEGFRESDDSGFEMCGDVCDGGELVDGGEVDDEGVPGWALLGGEDACDGFWRERVGSEAVDGFGGKGDEAAFAEESGGAGDVGGEGGVEMEGLGHVAVLL